MTRTSPLPPLPSTLIAPIIAVGVSWLSFVVLGQTPPVRAAALALTIGGMALVLRAFGAPLAILGSLALAITPIYWSQTGGVETYSPVIIGGAALLSLLPALVTYRVTKSAIWSVGAAIGLLIVAVLIAQTFSVGGSRSLRLTTLLTTGLLILLTDAIRTSNPRPDAPPGEGVRSSHLAFLLGIFVLGVINDPMITLFAPALLLGIALTRHKLLPILWLFLIGAAIFGAIRLINVYVDPFFWQFPVERAIAIDLQVPFLIGGAWRDGGRWIDLIGFVTGQFTIVGSVLAVIGLARLARWYPPLGVVTLVAFGTYALFGLLYFGGDAPILLLPLLMIELIWITYALAASREWAEKLAMHSRKWRSLRNTI